jgi:hypothetical protein
MAERGGRIAFIRPLINDDGEVVKVRFAYQLPDGGRVDITDGVLVPMGDVVTYRELTYTNAGVEIVFEVRDRVPGCVSIKLRPAEGERHIRAKDLAAIKLDQLRDECFAVAGVFTPISDGEGLTHTVSAARKLTERSATRRKVTPELLSRVAEIYTSTPATQADARVDAVVAAFGGISKRQAWRYIAQAKREGLIK